MKSSNKYSIILKVTDAFNFKEKVKGLLPLAERPISSFFEFKYKEIAVEIVELADKKQIVNSVDLRTGRWPLPMEELIQKLPSEVSKILLFNLDMIIDEKDLD